MTPDVDIDLRFDGRPGRGSIRARGGRLVVEPDGWRSVVGLGVWVLRRSGARAAMRGFAAAAGLSLYLKVPGLPRIRLA